MAARGAPASEVSMASLWRGVLYGFLVWLLAFAVAFLIFPLRESWRALFESIMPVVVTMATSFFAVLYFRRVEKDFLREGAKLGGLWLAMNVLFDLPLMLTPPIDMGLGEYFADVAVTYLIIPAVTIGISLGAARPQKAAPVRPPEENRGP
jgi:hypothetical protein